MKCLFLFYTYNNLEVLVLTRKMKIHSASSSSSIDTSTKELSKPPTKKLRYNGCIVGFEK